MRTREIELRHNRPLRVGRAGTIIECRAGTVWVTNPALGGDLFLRAGESQRLPGGTTLVEALGRARVVVHPPATCWRRIVAAAAEFCASRMRGRNAQYPGVPLSRY
jgi:hypothetical protein